MAEAQSNGGNPFEGEDDLTTKNGVSDQFVDPWCEPCLEDINTKIDAICYCPVCNVCLCKSCDEFHKKLPITQNHRVLRGSRMLKSHADKPVKYPDCKYHAGNTCDHYCFDHGRMLCKNCMEHDHQECGAQIISDICKHLESEDVKEFGNVVYKMKADVISIKSEMEKNVSDLDTQKQELLKKAERERDKIISKAEELFEATVTSINERWQKGKSRFNEHVLNLKEEIHALDEIIHIIDKKINVKFNINIFIQLQHVVVSAQDCKKEIDSVIKSCRSTELSFMLSKGVSDFLNNIDTLGNIEEVLTVTRNVENVADIFFPSPSAITKERKVLDRKLSDISQIRVKKSSSWNVKIPSDTKYCDGVRIAITVEGKLLVSDRENNTVKLFSNDGNILSSVTVSDLCYNIAKVTATTVAVGSYNGKLHILDISDPKMISIQKTVELGSMVVGVTSCNDKLVVTVWNEPKSVKMIDINGQEIWSVSTGPDGQIMFKKPYGVAVIKNNDAETVVVSDWGKNFLALLDANNGTLVKTIDMNGKGPHGIAVDDNGNMFVSCFFSREVCIWSRNFTQSSTVLADQDLQQNPIDVAYNCLTAELFVTYLQSAEVDRFKLSF